MRKILRLIAVMVLSGCVLCGCMPDLGNQTRSPETIWTDPIRGDAPEIPESLETDESGVARLKVYDVSTERIEEMNLEEYLEGVVAGEMKNDWPMEALKAQAILARTFVLKFCATKQSKYEGADISTDVVEAQAYAPENINDRVRRAVAETRGMVISSEGEYVHAWFFAHSGGRTELPSVALDYRDADPEYLSVVESPDSEDAPQDVQHWTAEFSMEEVRRACADAGVKVDAIETIEVSERGASGRAKTLVVNGKKVSAPSFRIQIGANRLKSTLIERIDIAEEKIVFTGRGFGHGVGMSQWGAYALAEEGKTAEQIIRHYFKDVDIARLWQ